jgi:WD40 repeat protein
VTIGRMGGRDVIVSGGSDGTVRIWDENVQPIGGPLTGHAGWVQAVAIGSFGGRDVIVSAGFDRTVRIWDEQGPLGDPMVLFERPSSLAIHAEGIVVAAGLSLIMFRLT